MRLRRFGSDGMRLATLNIGGPSVVRAEALLRYLPALGADVLALTETRPNDGTRLLIAGLRQQGWSVVDPTIAESRERGVALAFRETARCPDFETSEGVTLAHRLAGATVTSFAGDAVILGVYVPSRDASTTKIARKQTFIDQLMDVVRDHAGRPLVLLGDLNVVSRSHIPKYSAFRSWEYDLFDALGETDLVDAFSYLHPSTQAHSWIGRTGAGYRYDYAFVSASLATSISSCVYDHTARDARLTDHAAVILTVADSALALASTATTSTDLVGV
jgi:exodeoxyribonuclease-3